MIRPGSILAHYEIVSTLGKGGMGEVWLARDTKLGREVAIKTLPPEFALDGSRRARFEREARSLAALNHPNIASIHGFEESSGQYYLVLELAEGETLEERLKRGPIPREEALRIGLQIAEALEAAHDRGIIHRDLKPANIKITSDGTVKVLDFGLAKSFRVDGQAVDDPPTLTGMTEIGAVVGTPAYMSPEQARGEEIDARSDIWAFGVIFHEMLTGQPLFESRTNADTLARVLAPGTLEPDLPTGTPPLIARLISRCLQRRVGERLRHIGDARIDIRDTLEGRPLVGGQTSESEGARAPITMWIWAGTIAAVSVLAAFVGRNLLSEREQPAPVEHYAIATAQPLFEFLRAPVVAVSPSGTQIAYTAQEAIFIYSTERGTTRSLGPGEQPAFSADGRYLAFANRVGELVRVPVSGGASELLATTGSRRLGLAWGNADLIVFATNEGLFRVATTGAPVELLGTPDADRGELYFGWPEVLPGDRTVVFTILPTDSATDPQLALLDLETLGYAPLGLTGSGAKYVEPGYLVYSEAGQLVAVDFDLRTLTPGNEHLELGYALTQVAPSFDIAAEGGSLVYVPPPGLPTITMVWTDPATGAEEPARMDQAYIYSRVSPDGTKVIGDRNIDGNRDLFVWDLTRGVETRFTTDPAEDLFGEWSTDGETIYFTSDRGSSSRMGIYSRPANGSQPARPHYVQTDATIWLQSLDANHGIIALEENDLISLSTSDPVRATRLLSLEAEMLNPVISPDGNWLAYQSTETGRTEVSIRRVGGVEGTYFKASSSGGSHPIWSPDGRKLYYVDFEGMMQAVEIHYQPEFSLGEITPVFPAYYGRVTGAIRPNSGRTFDIAPDGRFLLRKTAGPGATDTIQLVRNWDRALR